MISMSMTSSTRVRRFSSLSGARTLSLRARLDTAAWRRGDSSTFLSRSEYRRSTESPAFLAFLQMTHVLTQWFKGVKEVRRTQG